MAGTASSIVVMLLTTCSSALQFAGKSIVPIDDLDEFVATVVGAGQVVVPGPPSPPQPTTERPPRKCPSTYDMLCCGDKDSCRPVDRCCGNWSEWYGEYMDANTSTIFSITNDGTSVAGFPDGSTLAAEIIGNQITLAGDPANSGTYAKGSIYWINGQVWNMWSGTYKLFARMHGDTYLAELVLTQHGTAVSGVMSIDGNIMTSNISATVHGNTIVFSMATQGTCALSRGAIVCAEGNRDRRLYRVPSSAHA